MVFAAAGERKHLSGLGVVAHQQVAGSDVLHRFQSAVEQQHPGTAAEAFTHTGPRGEDHQVGGLPAGGQPIQVGKTRRHPCETVCFAR